MSPDVAGMLLALLNAQQLNVGAADFDETAERVMRARRELQALLAPETAATN